MSYQNYQPRALTCCDCNQQFIFTAEDQEFHAQKGFTNDPKRCQSCRAARRAERGTGDSSNAGYGRTDRQMYPAVCAECGKATEVPFEPRGTRPVYCGDCFRRQSNNSNDSYGNSMRYARTSRTR